MARKRVAVLISGRGSNMSALVEAASAKDYPAEIMLVVSNRPGAPGISRAEQAGIGTVVLDDAQFEDRAAFEHALDARLDEAGIELVCLAGFMRVLSPQFVDRWRGRMINIHPSLLPAFPGLNTHASALLAGAREHGCTVHFVTAEVDRGPVIAQAEVPVLPGDSPATLGARVLSAEHRLYPRALAEVASGRATIDALAG
jgi:phosphoribosylglycinamide formyltransferase-1